LSATENALRALIGRPAIDFVKHREPMLFLDRLVDIGTEFVVCEWQVGPASAMLEAGRGVPIYAGIEYMAQCVAVHSGAMAHVAGNAPPLGLLLGTRQFDSTVQYLREGSVYRAICEEQVRDGQGMGSYACRIEDGGTRVATANLAVYELKDGLDTL
jgi:predicted hotdog family 3-hydroxylacyl-ACP dehydratase